MIDSPANPSVKLLRSLEAPKNIREHGLFVVEGVRAVEDALRSGGQPEVGLYDPAMLSRTERGRALLTRMKVIAEHGSGGRMLEASERSLQAASNTQHPQGVVVAFRIRSWPPPGALPAANEHRLALICDNVQDPGNLGTILRTSEAAGVQAAWLTPECAYAYSPKVVRAGMGAHFRLPIYTDESWELIGRDLALCEISGSRVFAAESGATTTYDQVNWVEPAALIVSNEAHGLSESARDFVHRVGGRLVSIPMAGGTESLNASIAAAVILFEAARQRRASGRGAG